MITMADFVPEDAAILREPAEKVSFPLSAELREQALAMRQFLINSQDPELAEKYQLRAGVGVAAPQIGIGKQLTALYIMDFNEEGEATEALLDEIMVNPRILKHSVAQVALKEGEGCLSVPREVPGFVPRPKRATIEYQDLEGEFHQIRLTDYLAVVVQHEIDHLKGILFYDHIQAEAPWQGDPDLELI